MHSFPSECDDPPDLPDFLQQLADFYQKCRERHAEYLENGPSHREEAYMWPTACIHRVGLEKCCEKCREEVGDDRLIGRPYSVLCLEPGFFGVARLSEAIEVVRCRRDLKHQVKEWQERAG